MQTRATAPQDKQNSATPRVTKESSNGGTATFVDNRPSTVTQRKLQEAMTVQRSTTQPPPERRPPQGSARFRQIATAMGDRYGVDTSGLIATHNSSFPASLNAEATIQGNKIHFAPGRDTESIIKHEVAHAIDNTLHDTPTGDLVVQGHRVDHSREYEVNRMVRQQPPISLTGRPPTRFCAPHKDPACEADPGTTSGRDAQLHHNTSLLQRMERTFPHPMPNMEVDTHESIGTRNESRPTPQAESEESDDAKYNKTIAKYIGVGEYIADQLLYPNNEKLPYEERALKDQLAIIEGKRDRIRDLWLRYGRREEIEEKVVGERKEWRLKGQFLDNDLERNRLKQQVAKAIGTSMRTLDATVQRDKRLGALSRGIYRDYQRYSDELLSADALMKILTGIKKSWAKAQQKSIMDQELLKERERVLEATVTTMVEIAHYLRMPTAITGKSGGEQSIGFQHSTFTGYGAFRFTGGESQEFNTNRAAFTLQKLEEARGANRSVSEFIFALAAFPVLYTLQDGNTESVLDERNAFFPPHWSGEVLKHFFNLRNFLKLALAELLDIKLQIPEVEEAESIHDRWLKSEKNINDLLSIALKGYNISPVIKTTHGPEVETPMDLEGSTVTDEDG